MGTVTPVVRHYHDEQSGNTYTDQPCTCPQDWGDCFLAKCGDGSACHDRKLKQQEATRTEQALKALDAIERKDNVRRPDHYSRWVVEPVEFIMRNGLDFATGNVVKYVLRAPFKNGVEDLKKARRYLDMMIKKAEGDAENFAK